MRWRRRLSADQTRWLAEERARNVEQLNDNALDAEEIYRSLVEDEEVGIEWVRDRIRSEVKFQFLLRFLSLDGKQREIQLAEKLLGLKFS